MKTLHYISLFIIALGFQSCSWNINIGEKGNGHVVTQDRTIQDDFSAIKSSAGINVYITQGDKRALSVETDENLQKYIETKVSDGVLRIRPTTGIRRSTALKVYVTFPAIEHLEASSGSSIRSTDLIKSQQLSAKASSGASIHLNVLSENLELKSSSGSDIYAMGKTLSLIARSSSGSSIKAKELETIRCSATASSGSDIYVNVKENLAAKASSGGDINYYGNPTVSANRSSSGDVKKRG